MGVVMLDWNGVRDFLAVVEAGSLTAAAIKLKISQPTLSRRITAMEEKLGTRLLIRTPRHMQLTDAGRRIQELALRMGVDAHALESAALGLDSLLEGTVRISTTEIIGLNWLTPLLADFHETHPGIKIEMVIENSAVNLLRREAEIAVRLMPPTQQEIQAQHVTDIGFSFYAARSYIEKFGLPNDTSALQGHKGIGLIGDTSTSQWTRQIFKDEQIHFQFSTLLGVQRAVEAGMGIGAMFCYFGDQDPNLVRVLQHEDVVRKQVWLCTLPEYQSNVRIRAVHEFIATMFIKNRRAFKG
jgi:DNA-binding transcriptional LysR family regulator